MYLKQSTAHTFQLGPFLDDADGKTAEASLTIGDTDTFLSKAGAAFAAKNDTTDLTGSGDARGYYDCVLNTTDTGTLGNLRVHVHVAGALPVWQDFVVLPANVYDSLVAGSDLLDVNTSQAAGTAWGSGAITAASIATDALTAAKFASDVTTELQSGLATAAALATVDGIVDNLVSGIIFGAAATGTLSTTQASTNLTGYANDQLIGRPVIWLTGACEGEASVITDYVATSGVLTFDALTTAPGNGDTFKIV